jgi:hypothetical protein
MVYVVERLLEKHTEMVIGKCVECLPALPPPPYQTEIPQDS